MTIVGQDVLRNMSRRNPSLRKWLTVWVATVEQRRWHSLGEVRIDYPSADGIKLKSMLVVTVFNVKGNEYRLLTSIDFDAGLIEILDVLTHAEYDKNSWKARY